MEWLLAHGVGNAEDLPIPRDLAVAGAVAALVVSFTVLAVAWRTPRFADAPARPAPAAVARLVDSRGLAWTARAFGLALLLFGGYAAVLGEDVLINPAFRMFYILLWVGIVPASLLLGPFYRAVSPARSINLLVARIAGTDPGEGLYRYPERLGMWPAAVGLFAFVWLELVFPGFNELGPVRLWFATYLAVMLLGGVLFGDRFLARADPFEVFSTLVGRLSVWARHDGRLVLRSPLANLAGTPVLPGLLAVVAVLFGSTSYDSFRESPLWTGFVTSYDGPVPGVLLSTGALLGFCVGVGGVFVAACAATGVRSGTDRRSLAGLFAHSVVPIVVGYFVAHYLSLFVEDGQTLLIQMSDPLSDGSDLFGTADRSVNYWLSLHPTFLATTKVLGVVVGHVLGAVAAHDRALELLPPRHQLTGQLSLLAVMVLFTAGGLLLLFAA